MPDYIFPKVGDMKRAVSSLSCERYVAPAFSRSDPLVPLMHEQCSMNIFNLKFMANLFFLMIDCRAKEVVGARLARICKCLERELKVKIEE